MGKKLVAILIISIIGLLSAYFIIKKLPELRFGYFIKINGTKYRHFASDMLKMDNGNILILGHNEKINSPNKPAKFEEVPSEIFDYKESKFHDLKLPNTIKYLPKGIMLSENKLLLTYVSDLSDNSEFYNSMAIVNLNINKIEKIIKKEITTPYEYGDNNTKFLYLNDNSIFIFDYKNKIAEIYDLKTNKSTLIKNIKYNQGWNFIYALEQNNDVLIFGTKCTDTSDKNYCVLKYNKQTKTFTNTPIEPFNYNSSVIKLNNNKVAIIENSKINILDSSTFDLLAKSDLIEKREEGLCYWGSCSDAIQLSDNLILITGGKKGDYPDIKKLKTAEIYDLNNQKSYKITNMPIGFSEHKMIELDDGNIIILETDNPYSKKTVLFKYFKFGQYFNFPRK